MTKSLLFFRMAASVCAMCFTGFIAAQNLIAQIDGMLGGWRLSFWDLIWTDPAGIHLSFTFVAVFGAVFYVLVRVTLRYHILTRNHVIVILAGIVLFIIFSDYLVVEDAGWSD